MLDRHKVAAARIWATAQMPYLAHAVFAAPVREVMQSGTVSIDRAWTISADPEVVEQLDAVDLGRVLLHLVCHPLRDHADRAEALAVDDLRWWNSCGDAEINDDLRLLGAVSPLAPTVPGDLGCEDNGLAEAYYGTAVRHPCRGDCGSGSDGVCRPWEGQGTGLDPAQRQLLRHRTAADVQQAHSREPGSVPLGLVRWAESLRPSRVDWRALLATEIRRAVASVSGNVDYTYRRPSRRGDAAKPAVLPSLHRPLPLVAVVCDTSGSMSEDLLARVLAEVEAMLTRAGLRSAQLRVLAVDTEVHAVRTVTRASDVVLSGGGGTDMGAGLDCAVRLRPRPSLVVVLTDGYTPWPSRAPRGVRVVVGLLAQGGQSPAAPSWATAVVIDE